MTAPHFLMLLLGGLWLQPVRAGSHSLLYFFSSLSRPLPGVPQFSSVGYLDDVPIAVYTSESLREEPRAPWMERITTEDPQYWERNTEILREWEQQFKGAVRNMMGRLNQTRGLHMFQRMSGCELREDGSIGRFTQYAFDGHDYISLDRDKMTFTAAMDVARTTQDRWNSERSIAQIFKYYLEELCIEYLKKHLNIGKKSLQRVSPKTRISRRKSRNRTFLTGYAYGFYPRDIDVKWVRNGVEIPWESRELLPNPDGTYQVRLTVEVPEGDDEKIYKYEVYHSSLPEIVTVVYEEKSLPKAAIIAIVGTIVGVALLAAIISVLYFGSKTSGRRSDPATMTGDPAPTASSSSQGSV
ncbi:class I histocompatibility antigen, Gogo-OKO alpha chain-like [Lissotriton helveticus]